MARWIALATTIAASFVLCLPAQAYKKELTGFQDLVWGDTVQTVTAKLKKRYRLVKRSASGAPLFVGTFAGFRECSILPYFQAGKLHQVRVAVASQDGMNTVDVFAKLKTGLMSTYGPVTLVAVHDIDGDGAIAYDEENPMSTEDAEQVYAAVLARKKWVKTEWAFPDTAFITLYTVARGDEHLDRPLYVSIDYYSEAAFRRFSKDAERRNQADF